MGNIINRSTSPPQSYTAPPQYSNGPSSSPAGDHPLRKGLWSAIRRWFRSAHSRTERTRNGTPRDDVPDRHRDDFSFDDGATSMKDDFASETSFSNGSPTVVEDENPGKVNEAMFATNMRVVVWAKRRWESRFRATASSYRLHSQSFVDEINMDRFQPKLSTQTRPPKRQMIKNKITRLGEKLRIRRRAVS